MILKLKEKKLPVILPAAEEALALRAMPLGKKSAEQKLLRFVMAHANAKDIKKLGGLLVGGGVAVSLAGSFVRNRITRAAVARELKKQLAPINRKLDALEKQNEELKKQNEALRKQLR